MYAEIFAERYREKGRNFDLILSQVFQKESRHIKAVGFKVFDHHLTEDEWNKFVSYKEFKIIHLTRENRLRAIVSHYIGEKTHQHFSYAEKVIEPKEKRVSLDISKLIDSLEKFEKTETLTRERFRGRQLLEVVYENLVRKPRQEFECMGDFLDVSGIDSDRIPLTRQNPEELEQLIINYEAVYRLLKNTKFAKYLSS
jgi:LPS sulfotransferase NodH